MADLESTVRKWEAEEHRFLGLEADYLARTQDLTPETRLRLNALFETARRTIRESKERVARVLEDRGGDDA